MFSRFAQWSKAARDGSLEQLRLHDLEGQLRAIDRSLAVIEFSLDGTILKANDNFLRATGYTLPEVQGQHHRMFVDPQDANSAEYRQFWEHLGRGEYHSGQYRRLAKGGRELWLQASYNPILDTQGRPVKVVKYCTDVTEQKRRAADHEGQIAAIDKSQAVIEFELDGTIRRANENFLRAVGYAAHELQGKHHRMFVDPQTANSPDYAAFWDRLGQGRFDAGVYRRIAKGGREIWLQATYNPIADASGRPFKVVKYASDITEHKKLTDRLAAMVDNIKTSAAEIQVSAEEISKGNTSLSGRVESQAAGLEQTSASMARMTETVRANAERARQASEFAVTARERAEQGGKVMGEAVAAMQAIETSSQQIADIIGVIDGIAFQTNLLALNAAVEAARANEHGRGFAVVASEVRSLAGRSADAAKQIKALIEASVQKISVGVQLVGQSGSHLSEIVSSVKNVSEVVRDISGYCTEQADGINEVGRAVAQMEESTQQNAAMVEEAAAASESIVDQVRELNAAVSDDMSSLPSQQESQVRKPAAAQASAVSRIRPVERVPLARSAPTKMRQRV